MFELNYIYNKFNSNFLVSGIIKLKYIIIYCIYLIKIFIQNNIFPQFFIKFLKGTFINLLKFVIT